MSVKRSWRIELASGTVFTVVTDVDVAGLIAKAASRWFRETTIVIRGDVHLMIRAHQVRSVIGFPQ